ncbi:ABC transporter ATP-binding protein [Clostridium lundense]|uniref:ABC transporter ATP-binding protein n=1 Tax=Clostridium lundense TaxID=319475 RepID=UPI000481781F|nr:ABC transporter ATP-binding protein [Clostridium lundense]
MKSVISIKNLYFNYGSRQVIKGITADINQGELYALFGPNGSGKTTLLKCITGLLKYKKGNIKVMDKEIKELSPKQLSKYISYVPQDHKLSFPFTVEEVVLMGRTPHLGGFLGPAKEDIEYANKAIKRIGIEDICHRCYTELSGGQRQLVLLARAIAQDTPIMVLDEPTSALDFKNQINVWRILKSLKEYNKTIITCTHDPNHVSWFCDSVVVIDDGYIIKQGITSEVMINEVLNSLYKDTCAISLYNGMNMVVPKNNVL